MHEWAQMWPVKRFPVLVEGDRTLVEATCVIEYLTLQVPASQRDPRGSGSRLPSCEKSRFGHPGSLFGRG